MKENLNDEKENSVYNKKIPIGRKCV